MLLGYEQDHGADSRFEHIVEDCSWLELYFLLDEDPPVSNSLSPLDE